MLKKEKIKESSIELIEELGEVGIDAFIENGILRIFPS